VENTPPIPAATMLDSRSTTSSSGSVNPPAALVVNDRLQVNPVPPLSRPAHHHARGHRVGGWPSADGPGARIRDLSIGNRVGSARQVGKRQRTQFFDLRLAER